MAGFLRSQTEFDMATPDLEWREAGKCRHLPADIFFPQDGVRVEVARQICADCPVKEPCLEYALANRISEGVWGGSSERQRRRLARQRRSRALSSA
jgi:WhiB family redox-sensing transcriptional regulator